jgi:hypothetical protein
MDIYFKTILGTVEHAEQFQWNTYENKRSLLAIVHLQL